VVWEAIYGCNVSAWDRPYYRLLSANRRLFTLFSNPQRADAVESQPRTIVLTLPSLAMCFSRGFILYNAKGNEHTLPSLSHAQHRSHCTLYSRRPHQNASPQTHHGPQQRTPSWRAQVAITGYFYSVSSLVYCLTL
jgi:hypothetical protein